MIMLLKSIKLISDITQLEENDYLNRNRQGLAQNSNPVGSHKSYYLHHICSPHHNTFTCNNYSCPSKIQPAQTALAKVESYFKHGISTKITFLVRRRSSPLSSLLSPLYPISSCLARICPLIFLFISH